MDDIARTTIYWASIDSVMEGRKLLGCDRCDPNLGH
jgi:hypothetical protein